MKILGLILDKDPVVILECWLVKFKFIFLEGSLEFGMTTLEEFVFEQL
jgi:hypothetical protein